MTAREDLVTGGLMGVRRHPVTTHDLPGPVGAMVRSLPPAAPAPALLDALAVDVVARRSAVPSPHAPSAVPDVPPDETARVAPGAAAVRLAGLLARPDARGRTLLAAWLAAAADRDVVAPPWLLPDLLDLATSSHRHAVDVAPVIGARGRWLAGVRPGWAQAVARADAELARRPGTVGPGPGAADARTRMDDPGFARLPAAERTACVETVGADPGAEDEHRLERALADRAAGVRHAAARALVAVPGSVFARRCQEHALAAVRTERRGLRRGLAVTLPDVADDEPLLTPGTTGGRRAALLVELVAATPPDRWEQHLGGAPAELVRRAVADDLGDALRTGWSRAATRTKDAAWATALLGRDAGDPDPGLVGVLPPAEQVAVLLAALRASRPGPGPTGAVAGPASDTLWHSLATPWAAPVVEGWLTWFVSGPGLVTWRHGPVGDLLAASLPVDPVTEARVRDAATRVEDATTTRTLQDVADALLVRRQMLEELA